MSLVIWHAITVCNISFILPCLRRNVEVCQCSAVSYLGRGGGGGGGKPGGKCTYSPGTFPLLNDFKCVCVPHG